MKSKLLSYSIVFSTLVFFEASLANAQIPNNPTFTRKFTIASGIEGLTGKNDGTFYVVDRGVANANCSVWKIDSNATPDTAVQVGQIPTACRPSGLTFDKNGDLFITTAILPAGPTPPDPAVNVIYKLTPNQSDPTAPEATGAVVIKGVFGANGVAFDNKNRLYISDGITNQGRVWRANVVANTVVDCSNPADTNCQELFRIQPMRNDDALGGNVTSANHPDGVGRRNFSFPAGVPGGAQDLVANGLAFFLGNLYVLDTARGAIWKVDFDLLGNVKNDKGCDETFHDNTLCMDSLWLAHPKLEGADGGAFDILGNLWIAANERNALVAVNLLLKKVVEFQNPADPVTYLRNNGPLEFPTSPFLSGKKLCITHADSARRDNAPNNLGEIAGTGAGKVSCMDQNLLIPGLPLPVK
jgi:sugar lactone lactonase YvrE